LQEPSAIPKKIEVGKNFRPPQVAGNRCLKIAAELIPAGVIGRRAERGLRDADEQADERNALMRDGVEIGDFRGAAEEFVKADERMVPVEPAHGNPRVSGEIEISHWSVIRTSRHRDRGMK